MTNRRGRRIWGLFLFSLLALPGMVAAAEFQFKSDTLFRYFERDTGDEERSVAPAYEYLQLDIGSATGPGPAAAWCAGGATEGSGAAAVGVEGSSCSTLRRLSVTLKTSSGSPRAIGVSLAQAKRLAV